MNEKADQLRAWVHAWHQAGPELERIRQQELSSLDNNQYLATFDGLLQWACDHAAERMTSGLVEQQRLFARLRGIP